MVGLSIIVPVYNVDRYLKECVDSLLREAPEDSEIILVDDGSADKSAVLCESYLAKDNRIRVIHQTNGGLSVARNAGIELSEGKRVFFLDSDDYLSSDYFEKMLKYNADLVIGNYYAFYTDREPIEGEFCSKEYQSLSEYLADFHIYFATIFNFGWGKVYNSDIINNNHLRFSPGISMVEDVLFNIDYYRYCDKICVVSDAVIYYRQGNSSLSKRYYSEQFRWYQESYQRIWELLDESNRLTQDNVRHFNWRFLGNMFECVRGAANLNKPERAEQYRLILEDKRVQTLIRESGGSFKACIMKCALLTGREEVITATVKVFSALSNIKRKLYVR